jgi:chaperone modulatory protein CbpM
MTERNLPIEPDAGDVDLEEICVILELDDDVVVDWVAEGVVRPADRDARRWRFTVGELERARRARRLQHDLGLNTASLPLVLDLLGEVRRLRRRVRLLEDRYFE